MQHFGWLCVGALVLGACGGDPVEAKGGFATPDTGARAWTEEGGIWVDQGVADFSCLNTPKTDVATSVAITLSIHIEDFQTGSDVPEPTVTAFDVVDVDNPFATATVVDSEKGDLEIVIPAGHTRIGFEVNAAGQMRTLLLNQYLVPDESSQSLTIGSISEITANTLLAFVGITRTRGRGVLAGAMRDCAGNEVSHTIATVSSVQGEPEHLDGAECTEEKPCTESYYFSGGNPSLPVRRSQQPSTNSDGLFMASELPLQASAFLQLWGFVDGQDPATDDLSLLAEIPSPIFNETIVTFSLEPLRQ